MTTRGEGHGSGETNRPRESRKYKIQCTAERSLRKGLVSQILFRRVVRETRRVGIVVLNLYT